MPSRMPKPAGPTDAADRGVAPELVDGAGRSRSPIHARCRAGGSDHGRGGGRRLPSLRQPPAADGLSRPGAERAFVRKTARRGGITKAGNTLARRVLIEGAWTYRMPARVSRKLHDRLEPLPAAVRDIAWKAQLRLCARYRRLFAAGKPKVVVTTAIAREMVGFIWAIALIVQPVLA